MAYRSVWAISQLAMVWAWKFPALEARKLKALEIEKREAQLLVLLSQVLRWQLDRSRQALVLPQEPEWTRPLRKMSLIKPGLRLI